MTQPFSAQDLIEAGRKDHLGSADQHRLREGLDRALAAQPAPAPWRRLLPWSGGLAALATALWLGARPAPSPELPPAPLPPPPPDLAVPAAPWAPAPPPAPPGNDVAVAPAPSQLAEETRLVREAQKALAAKDGARALEALETHARRFPDGVLREAREAARVLALCALGRVDEARAEAAAFLQRAPSSPQAARVRAACASR